MRLKYYRREVVARGRGRLLYWKSRRGNARVRVGRHVRMEGRIHFFGPGSVVIGDYCNLNGSGSPVTPFTYSPDAIISIGDHCFVNGTRFGSAKEITIGSHCVLADARIMDLDFHPLDPAARRRGEPGAVGTVRIGNDVWVAAGAIILRNTVIGAGSVVGAGAVVKGEFPERSMILGNPAKLVGRID